MLSRFRAPAQSYLTGPQATGAVGERPAARAIRELAGLAAPENVEPR
jgi:hypothetical protein